MPVITLTSDFGNKDHFVGSVKGSLNNEIPNVNIIDISNDISPFNIIEGAYIIENAYKNFPEGSIHIIGVDSEKTPEKKHLVIKLDGHYFICADNGIMSLVANRIKPEKIIEINIHNSSSSSFTVLDVFVKVAAHIYRGGSIDLVGNKIFQLKELYDINPILNEKNNEVTGNVIYIDNYENVVTNISKLVFEEFGKSRPYVINARNYKFNSIVNSYSESIKFDIKK
ncbi:MAG: SAM-dependent chlorinase/fluorinase, partial [Flavobacteriaceae bacterium]|nr:SAM-dependent chlorinase/fluorinase [Flavobacteriaceae bacterium]